MNEPYPLYFKVCIRLLLFILIVFIVIEGRELLIPLTIAIFLTFILLPVSKKLEQFHVPRSLAIIISIFLAILIVGGFVFFIYLQIQSFGDDLSDLKMRISEKSDAIQHFIHDHFNVSKKDQVNWFNKKVAHTIDQADEILIAFFTTTGTLITNLFLIPIYIYCFTLYRYKIKKFIALVANGEQKHTLTIIYKILEVAQKYLKGLMFDVSIVTVILSIGFMLLGVRHAVLFALLVGVLNVMLPYIGITIGSILPFCMMLLTQDSFGPAAGVVLFCCVMQFTDNHFINPFIVGSSVSINPLSAFIALVFGALIWGIYGMLLCIPITGMIKVVCDNIDNLKPFGFIIGQEMEFGQDAEHKKKRFVFKLMKSRKKPSD